MTACLKFLSCRHRRPEKILAILLSVVISLHCFKWGAPLSLQRPTLQPSKSTTTIPSSLMSSCISFKAQPAQCLGHSKVTLPPFRAVARASLRNLRTINLDLRRSSSSFAAKASPWRCKFMFCHNVHGLHGSEPHKSVPGFSSTSSTKLLVTPSFSMLRLVSVHLTMCTPTSLATLPIMESSEAQNSIIVPCPGNPWWCGSYCAISAGSTCWSSSWLM